MFYLNRGAINMSKKSPLRYANDNEKEEIKDYGEAVADKDGFRGVGERT